MKKILITLLAVLILGIGAGGKKETNADTAIKPEIATDNENDTKNETADDISEALFPEQTAPAEEPEFVPEPMSLSDAEYFDYSKIPEFKGEGEGNAWYDVNGDVPFFTDEEMSFKGQVYWDLDDLGRCIGAMAYVGPETLPSEARDSDLSSVTPTGWHQARYEGIDPDGGDWLYNRCHLIGYQLTGQNIEERNLITGTRYLNVVGMLPFEGSVRQYVDGTGNHVIYRIRPYFEGDELLCRGVLMEARSMEDEEVQFCAFCYNVQPGIGLNYETGESWLIETETETRSNIEEEEPEEETYILNTSSKKFHKPSCSSVDDMKEKNKREVTASRDELISDGYAPCKRCNP